MAKPEENMNVNRTIRTNIPNAKKYIYFNSFKVNLFYYIINFDKFLLPIDVF